MGRKQCPRFQLRSPLLPGGAACLSMAGGSEHPWDGASPDSGGLQAKLGHFNPALSAGANPKTVSL